jgi:CRP/FNR family transcriptional regulator, cyclic AMP receptor protein
MTSRRHADSGNAALVEALGNVTLFSGLPKKTLQVVADMCRSHDYSLGDEIVTQGDKSGRFFLIFSGGAEVVVNGHVVNMLGPGQYFGEYAVIDQQPRSASVVATTDVHAYSLASITLRPLLKEEPEITYRLLLNACQRLRATQDALH